MYTFEDKLSDVTTKDLLRIINSNKEYFIVNYRVSNSGAAVWVNCTDTYKDIGSSSTYNGYDYIFSLYSEELHTIQHLLIKRLGAISAAWTKFCYDYSDFKTFLNKYDLSLYNYGRLQKLDKEYGSIY